MELVEFEEKDFKIVELFLRHLNESETLSDNQMLEICKKENIDNAEYPNDLRCIILKYKAAAEHKDIRVIKKNENTNKYLKNNYFKQIKNSLIEESIRKSKEDKEIDLNIKNLKQNLIINWLAIGISIIAIIISIITLLSK